MSNRKDPRTADYLKVNDVLLLEWGTPVQWPDCPSYLLEGARPYLGGTADKLVQIGVPIERPVPLKTIRNGLTHQIIELFTFYRVDVDKNILQRFVDHHVPEPAIKSFMVPADLYVVTEIITVRDGRKTILKTYKPGPGRPEYSLYFYQGFRHATNMENVKVVADPDAVLASRNF
jgi:hypothetical protein